MANAEWQALAREAFSPEKSNELITGRASDITKIGAPVVALLGVLTATLLGDQFRFDPDKAETVIAAAIIVSTSISGVLLAYALDFRTRGRTAAARLDAIAQIAAAEIAREARDEDLRRKLVNRNDEIDRLRDQLAETQMKLTAAMEDALRDGAQLGASQKARARPSVSTEG